MMVGSNKTTRNKPVQLRLAAFVCCVVLTVVSPAAGEMATLTQTIQLTLSPATKVSAPSSLTLTAPGGAFSNYSGTLTLRYKSRTLPGGAGATITLKANGEFAPVGGPTVAGGALTYACSGATLGSGCSGSQTVSSTAQTPVIFVPPASCTGGGGLCSPGNPNNLNMNMQLSNSPAYRTGSYSTVLTFTVSSI
jgi:hypothetical protein